MTIDIKGKQGQIRVSVPIQEGAKGVFALMNADYIQLSFSSDTVIPFKLGDYADLSGIEYEGLGGKIAKVYEVVDMNNVNPTYNESTGAYDYNIRLDAYYWKWKNKIFKYTPENAGQEASWSLTAALDVHLGVFLRNLKALGYTHKGTDFTFSIDNTVENKAVSVTYDNTNLLDALFLLASEEYYNCDCWITDNVIHFGRNEFGDAVKIERGVEAVTIGKAESKGTYATRIYAFGGTRNIPTNYRPTDEQTVVNGVVQKRLMLPADTPYIDAYEGMTTEEAIEDVVVFDDIYPRRVGTISDVTTRKDTVTDEDGTQREVTYYRYKDTGIIFDEKYIIEGQELKVIFQSGKMNGMEFGVIFNPEGEDPAEQLWEIVANEDYGRLLPDDLIKPENGDTYVLSGFDIQLVSDQYIPQAEQELLKRAQKYADIAKKDDGTYPVTLFSDFVYADQLRHNYEFGQKVNLIDKAYFPNGRVSRILGWEINLDIPFDSPKYTVGESMPYSRIGEIEDKVDSLTYKGQTYTGVGGIGVYIIRTNDSTPASDSNVFSALRSLSTFLRKDKEDATSYLLRMLGGAHFFPFTQGMIGGSGAAFYKNAAGKVYMEADGAYLRDELIVPKITFNCIDVISGDKANTFAFGTIKSVDTDNKTAELDLLEDQAGTLHVDDICRGVFHNLGGNNQQDDMEDDNGFYGYAGFSTSYFTPTEIITNEPGRMVFRYSLQAGTSVHPMKGMNFFAYGNFTDKTRQSITYETRYYTRRLKDVNTWVIDPTKNISMQDGLLEGLTIGGMVMHGYGTFQENCYFTGVNIQFTPEIEDALKGQDAYNVSLSSYERTVKVDENGDLSSLAITTYIQAFKGETELLYSTSVEPGKYIASLNAHGCTAHIDAGSVIIDSITDYNGCYVDIEVNCEGNVVFNKTFSVSVIRDGKDGYEGSSPVVIDLDNEMSSVACNAEGDIVAGLPVKSGVAVYKGTEALEISEVAAEAPEGVTCSVDEETHSVTVSAIGKEVAESFGITVTATADDDGVPVTRSTVMTILKVKAGENATLYRLVPSANVVKIDKEGNYSESYVACSVSRINGKEMETLSALPEGFTMTVRKDGLAETAYSLNDDIVTNGLVRSVEFRLKKGDVLIDAETVPFVADGVDGLGSITLDLDNEMASVACDAEGKVTAGLPIVSTASLYYGTEKLVLDLLDVDPPAGVTQVSVNKRTGHITIKAIASYAPDVISVPVTCSGTYNGQSYERTAYIKINKVKPGANGENAVIYSLVAEPSAIKVDKNGNLSASSVSCNVKKTDGNSSSVIESLPEGYSIRMYIDGESIGIYTKLPVTTSVNNAMQSVGFQLIKGSEIMDEETVPVVHDGLDGLGSVTLDLDNEMASVACDAEGNVVNGLPITVNFSMYFGTEEMEITSVTNTFITGLVITNSASEAKSTITSISSSTPDTIELEYAVRGIYNSALYERKAVFRILKIQAGEDGKNAVIYQLFPSLNVIQVNKNGIYVNTSISCWLTKNDGGTVSTVTVLPSGMTMTYQRDDSSSEIQIGPGDSISTTSVSSKITFKLYKDNVLADMETVPVVKDGQDGQDGQPGAPGQDGQPGAPGVDGKQGIQGCVIRTSIWTTGREYRNDSTIDDDSVIRYIDVAMVRNNSYSTGWRAYLCLRTHTSSSSIGVSNTTYWSEFSQNVTAILTDLIIAKNAQLQFMQGNRLLIQKDDGTITAGISGSISGDKIRFWAGAEEPDNAPFRVDEKGNLIAQNGRFEGVIAGTLESLKTAGGEIDLDADKAWFNGIDLQNQGTVGGRPLRFYSSSIWCRNQFGAFGRITARVLTNSVYYYPNGTDKASTIYNMTAKTSTSGQRYYSIPCFGGLDDTPDNIAGMPVDTIVLSNSGSYYYELLLGPTQRVFVIHAKDDASSGSYIYVNGHAVAVQGGGSIIVQAIPSAWVKPSVASSTLGANQIVISEHDFNW